MVDRVIYYDIIPANMANDHFLTCTKKLGPIKQITRGLGQRREPHPNPK
jgi:hypothetical protein